MKHFFFLILLFAGLQGIGQTTVNIIPKDQTFCVGGTALFTVFVIPSDTVEFYYQWRRNGTPVTVPDSTQPRLLLKQLTYADTGYYTVTAVSSSGSFNSDTVHLHLRLLLTVDTLYRYNALGCPGTCKGQMKTHISGGNPPYDYDWGGGEGSQDTIVTSLCKGTYVLNVFDSDSTHCISREYKVEVLSLPKITFTKSDSILFLTNPLLTVQFADTSVKHLTNWEWTFFEGNNDSTLAPNINPATHTYQKTGMFAIRLNFTDVNGCDSTIYDSIRVKVAELKIPDVFTPNGDQANDNFVIQVKDAGSQTINDVYISNELVILNRWGKTVYKKSNYISSDKIGEWDGGKLAEGVYFFIFTGHGLYSDDVYKGSVLITGRKYKP